MPEARWATRRRAPASAPNDDDARSLSLSLSDSALAALPESALARPDLQRLYAERNQILEVPRSIKALGLLVELWLSDNRLKVLPAEIGDLAGLRTLHLRNNSLASLPEELSRCRSLATLTLSKNKLRQLPASFGFLTSLRDLWLDSNQLKNLPATFGGLTQLRGRRLRLNGNRGLRLPFPQPADLDICHMQGEAVVHECFSRMNWTPKRHLLFAGVGGCAPTFMAVALCNAAASERTPFRAPGSPTRPPPLPREVWWEIFRCLRGGDFAKANLRSRS